MSPEEAHELAESTPHTNDDYYTTLLSLREGGYRTLADEYEAKWLRIPVLKLDKSVPLNFQELKAGEGLKLTHKGDEITVSVDDDHQLVPKMPNYPTRLPDPAEFAHYGYPLSIDFKAEFVKSETEIEMAKKLKEEYDNLFPGLQALADQATDTPSRS